MSLQTSFFWSIPGIPIHKKTELSAELCFLCPKRVNVRHAQALYLLFFLSCWVLNVLLQPNGGTITQRHYPFFYSYLHNFLSLKERNFNQIPKQLCIHSLCSWAANYQTLFLKCWTTCIPSVSLCFTRADRTPNASTTNEAEIHKGLHNTINKQRYKYSNFFPKHLN